MLSEKRELQNTQNKLIQNPTLNIDKRRVLILERETGFEPVTSCLESKHSTTELLPQSGCWELNPVFISRTKILPSFGVPRFELGLNPPKGLVLPLHHTPL